MKNLKFYRVQNSNGTSPSLAPAEFTLSQLYNQIKKQRPAHTNFLIYYHFKPYSQQEHGAQKLSKIITNDPMKQPKFIIYETIDDGVCPALQKYGQGIAESQKLEQQKSSGISKKKQYSIGQNGTIIFENRATSLLASSVNHAATAQQYKQKKKQIVQNFNISIMNQEKNKKIQKPDQGVIKSFLKKIGLIKSDPSSKNLLNTIQTLKNIKSNQDLKQHQDRQYSDYDPKFATYLQSIYIKFAILNGCRLHYIEYKNMQDGIIKYRFPSNAKIAIIGDYGTGLSDSFGLLRHAIIQKESDIIIHLGDVYYAGTPNQYRDHIVKPLNQLRKQAGLKFKKNVLFYSIPGNHDYYSWGMPFLTFIANINEVKEINIQNKQNSEQGSQNLTSQISSYFCLRSEDNKWQFIGLDTAYYDSNPTNQINGFSLGPRLRHKQVQWFNDKMQTFPGSTILLTHHQLFSIHDRLEGSLSQYKRFSCINPLLSAQLFKYLPSISGWFWGHQHSIMFFEKDIFGVRKCRLLGNSSFHVFQKQGPYLRKPGFPIIPLIQQDQKYIHKYLPINPDAENKNNDSYFNLSYALIDFQKQQNSKFSLDSFASTIPVQYYCTPCYPQQNAIKQHFSPYLLYKQQLQPRIPTTLIQNVRENLIKEDRQIKNQEQFISSFDVVGNVQYIYENSQIYIKTQIGLYVDTGITLSLAGINFKITIQKLQVNSILIENETKLSQKQAQKQIQMEQIKQRILLNQKEELSPKPKNNIIQKLKIANILKLLQDGDIVYFIQNLKMQKIPLAQVQTMTKLQQKQQQKQILSRQPQLQLLQSVQITNQQLPPIAQDLVQQTLNFMQNILSQKKYVIKKYPILHDTSPKIKYGDAFSLKQITSGQYLTCSIGRFGSILKLKQIKQNQQPCLFMFLKQSKVKYTK